MKFIRWAVCTPIAILTTVLTWLFCWALACPYICVKTVNDREYLRKYIYWFQTFDAPLDEYTKAGYGIASPYIGRILWLCRNPAYGFAQFPFGVEPKHAPIVNGSATKWDTGVSNWEYTTWGNAFNYRAQWYFTSTKYLRINIGWKAHGGFTRLMLATHIPLWYRNWK